MPTHRQQAVFVYKKWMMYLNTEAQEVNITGLLLLLQWLTLVWKGGMVWFVFIDISFLENCKKVKRQNCCHFFLS